MAAKKEKTLDDLFYETLKDIYYAEKTLVKALPRMAKAAQAEELREAVRASSGRDRRSGRTAGASLRADRQARARQDLRRHQGPHRRGQGGHEGLQGHHALDAGLLSAAQAVEHYEISRYGTLKAWAEELGLDQVVRLLDATLQEEKKADKPLTQIAEANVETGGRKRVTPLYLAHVPETWAPVLRQGHAPLKKLRTCPDSIGTGHPCIAARAARRCMARCLLQGLAPTSTRSRSR